MNRRPRSNLLKLNTVFGKKTCQKEVLLQTEGLAFPLPGKSWIRHCNILVFLMQTDHYKVIMYTSKS